MTTNPLITGAHLRTYNTIFQHPISHNLKWNDVHSLFQRIGTIEEEPNGNLKVTRNGQTMMLHAHKTKDVSETEEVMALRHFIERTDAAPPAVNKTDTDWLLVIDHHEARIFRSEMHGAVPEQILPHEPEDYFRHAHNSKGFTRGQEKPEPNSFFEPVARALSGAGRILIFGTGTGMSNEMYQFIVWAERHHPELAHRIIGSVVVDESHLTADQLLAKARGFYAETLSAQAGG